jgi:hypothetical protein
MKGIKKMLKDFLNDFLMLSMSDRVGMVAGAVCIVVLFFGMCWLPEIVKAFLY